LLSSDRNKLFSSVLDTDCEIVGQLSAAEWMPDEAAALGLALAWGLIVALNPGRSTSR
jgi:hypothetical protein